MAPRYAWLQETTPRQEKSKKRGELKKKQGAHHARTIERVRSLSPAPSRDTASKALRERSVHRIRRGHATTISVHNAVNAIPIGTAMGISIAYAISVWVTVCGCCRREIAAEWSHTALSADAIAADAVSPNAVASNAVSAKRDFFWAQPRHVVGVAPRSAPSIIKKTKRNAKNDSKKENENEQEKEKKENEGGQEEPGKKRRPASAAVRFLHFTVI